MYLTEQVSLTVYAIVYPLVILVFAAFYWSMPAGGGLVGPGGTAVGGFWTALYFSVTTITTVCYGDIVPTGVARTFACAEAFLGLVFMGIMLTKATSARLSYHVLRLFGAYAESRLEEYSSQLQSVEARLRDLGPEIQKAFPETPTSAAPSARAEFLKSFGEAIGSLHSFSGNFCGYLRTELDEGFFFADAPTNVLVRTSEGVQRTVIVLSQVFIALSPQARIVALDESNLRRVNRLLNDWRDVSGEIVKRSKNSELKKSFRGIGDVCAQLAGSFVSVPPARKEIQPDQVLPTEAEQKLQ